MAALADPPSRFLAGKVNAPAAASTGRRCDRVPMGDQYLGEPNDPQRTQRVRGKQSIRIARQVGVDLPHRPRPVGARSGQQRIDHVSVDRRDVKK